jgi:uncharacterized repeat protein (TIGR03803 family)
MGENTFTSLHSFNGTDGKNPLGGLTADGTTLYGMTYEGGTCNNNGTIFKFDTASGNHVDALYSFTGGSGGGAKPGGDLTISGSVLYGMTGRGGSEGDVWSTNGTVFRIDTDGSDFNLLHAFTGEDGANPGHGALALSGSDLLGMTQRGGDNDLGTIFTIGTDGNGFDSLHSFTGGIDDGAYPYGQLTLDGSTMYGMTTYGGSKNVGVVFSATIPEPSTLVLLAIGAISLFAWRRRRAA